MAKRARPSKYGAKSIVLDGIKFDSIREGARYNALKLLQRAGEICELECHPVYELAPAVKFAGAKRKKPALRYVADFRYFERPGLVRVVEDVKSPSTAKLASFQIKRHLLKTIHGLDVRIIH